MRRKIVAGNWKMNMTFSEADDLISGILEEIESNGKPDNVDAIICPPALYLELGTDMASGKQLFVGAQNVNEFEKGAYTGEISAPMLRDLGCRYVIIGHSERRHVLGEDDGVVAAKFAAALRGGLTPILCVGELESEREQGVHFDVVARQLRTAMEGPASEPKALNAVIAYEPVWAIGTGRTATPADAQHMHAFIRQQLAGTLHLLRH